MKNSVLKIAILLLITQAGIAQQRIIHFVHGFGANPSAWFPVALATEQGAGSSFVARNAVTDNVSYSDPSVGTVVNNLYDAGGRLRQNIANFLTPRGGIGSANAKNSYVIAHSQGGLVSRTTADISTPLTVGINNAEHFGGLVTFGTPHAGAYIANSRSNGSLDVFLNQGCNDLGGGIIEQGLSNIKYGVLLNLLNAPKIVNNIVMDLKTDLCNSFFSKDLSISPPRTTSFLSQAILGPFLSSGGTRSVLEDPILNDYMVGAAPLNQLNTTPLQPMVRVGFYGKEINSQAFARTLHYMSKPSQALPAFTAIDAEENITLAKTAELRNKLENDYIESEYKANQLELNNCTWLWLFPPAGILCQIENTQIANVRDKLRREAEAYRKAYTWLDNSNSQWLSIIGARTFTTTVNSIRCECEENNGFDPIRYYTFDGMDCNTAIGPNGYFGVFCYDIQDITVTPNDEDNDGVVTKSSALAMPGAIPNPDAEMPGSQHMQMRIDPNMKDKLNKLYRGQIHAFFEIR